MIETRAQINSIVSEQLPEFVQSESPLLGEFLKQYYLSQEHIGGPINILENVDQYSRVGTYNTESLIGFTSTSSAVGFVTDVINVVSTDGFPSKYGIIKINDEIITYTSSSQTSFIGCKRGFSGITSYYDKDKTDSIIFEKNPIEDHDQWAPVQNITYSFLNELFSKLKYSYIPGFANRTFNEKTNVSNFISRSTDFYRSKGTDNAHEILFRALFGQDITVISPQDYLLRPSAADYSIVKQLVVEPIDGDPMDINGKTIYQGDSFGTVTQVEPIVIKGLQYYRISLDADYDRDIDVAGTLFGDFRNNPKTKVTAPVSIGASVIDVDSTVGYGSTGTLRVPVSADNELSIRYHSKNTTQFLGIQTGLTAALGIGQSVFDDGFAYAYDSNGEEINVRVSNVLKELDSNKIGKLYQSGDNVYASKLGTHIDLKPAQTIVHNSLSRSRVAEVISKGNRIYEATFREPHVIQKGDEVTMIDDANNTYGLTVTDVLSDLRVSLSGNIDKITDTTFECRREILKTSSDKYGYLNKYQGNVLNTYSDDHGNVFYVSNSLPAFYQRKISLSDRIITFSGTFSGETIQIVPLNSEHGFQTGDAVVYNGTSTTTTTTDFDGNVIAVDTTTETLDGLSDGIVYYVYRVDNNSIKLSVDRDQLFNSNYITVSGTITDHKFSPELLSGKIIDANNIVRKIPPVQTSSTKTKTEPGKVGILINGTEILNYKSGEFVYFGPLRRVNALSSGQGYDLITPPEIRITDSVGTGASVSPHIVGKFERIDVINKGFDYIGDINVSISGGNGVNASARANTQTVVHSEVFRPSVEVSNNSIGFATYHKFRDGEPVIYERFGEQDSISSSMVNLEKYFVSVIDLNTVKIHKTREEALSKTGALTLSAVGVGSTSIELPVQKLTAVDKKKVISSIEILNPGENYAYNLRTVVSTGINTASNSINIESHGYSSGEVITYSTSGTVIAGLSTSQHYQVIKVDNDNFRLAAAGIGTTANSVDYNTNNYVNFASTGTGLHSFNYPPISVTIEGSIGIATTSADDTFKASIQPIVRGSIVGVHLKDGGSSYGSEQIINHDRQPQILVEQGSGAQFQVILVDGSIKEIIVEKGGQGYHPTPDVNIESTSGTGCKLTPTIVDGVVQSVSVIDGGLNYSGDIVVTLEPSGKYASFGADITSWQINAFEKHKLGLTDDDGVVFGEKDKLSINAFTAQRDLRKNVYSLSPNGTPNYGNPDLVFDNNQEQPSGSHSPILGWAYDGNPIYGPNGTSGRDSGTVTVLRSGYTREEKANRPSLNYFPLGMLVEDHTFTGTGDLDEHNGRFCRTPEFPNGVYAYFMTVDSLRVASQGAYAGYREPIFPYVIGDTYKSIPDSFNFHPDSVTDVYDLTPLRRDTTFSKLNSDENLYESLFNPISNVETRKKGIIKSTGRGSIDAVGILTGGQDYKIGDFIQLNEKGTGGIGAKIEVSEIVGKNILSIASSERSFSGVEIELSSRLGFARGRTSEPHEFAEFDPIVISGLSTDFFGDVDKIPHPIRVNTATWNLRSGIGTTGATGISTFLYLDGPLDRGTIVENDILRLGWVDTFEDVKVLNVDEQAGRVRVLREQNNTTGLAVTTGDLVVERTRKFDFSVGVFTDTSYVANRITYFEPFRSVGLGTTAGVGIGSTIVVIGAGTTYINKFIPSQSIYLKDHGYTTGQKLIYSNGGGTSLGVSTNGIANYTLTDSSPVYVIVEDRDLIGLSTSKVGVGSTGYVGVGSEAFKLYYHTIGSGIQHSLKTQHTNVVTGTVSKIEAEVFTEVNNQLRVGDIVNMDIVPGITSTVTVKYNDYHRKVVINPKGIVNSGVNTSTNTFTVSSHGFETGDKVVFAATSASAVSGIPVGLVDNSIYYVVKIDQNTFKLSENRSASLETPPRTVAITSTGTNAAADQHISLINPPLKFTRGTRVKFDVSDSSLSVVSAGQTISAFDLNFYSDSKYEDEFYSDQTSQVFNVTSVGTVGVDDNASITLDTKGDVPNNLYYNLQLKNKSSLTAVKLEIVTDDEVDGNNSINVIPSRFNGKKIVTGIGSTSFKIGVRQIPEQSGYNSAEAEFKYKTTSASAEGGISSFRIKNGGLNYISLPEIVTINSTKGINANVNIDSQTIGKTVQVTVNDVGVDMPSDNTLRPSVRLPQVLGLSRLSIFDSVGVSSGGQYYNTAPDLIVVDSITGELIEGVELKAVLDGRSVSDVIIGKNPDVLYELPPTILAINNPNAIGIQTISWNSDRELVTVQLDVGFSTAGSFPFAIGDKVLIENVGVQTGQRGFNSKDYNYTRFELIEVDANIGGIGTVAFKLRNNPGTYNPTISAGTISPQIYTAQFTPNLIKKDFEIGERIIQVTSNSNKKTGRVLSWDSKAKLLRVDSPDVFNENDRIRAEASKTTASVEKSIISEAIFNLGGLSQEIKGWQDNVGYLSNDLNRLHDSDYYQYFSYSIKSGVDISTWSDAVSTLNHTVGYKKFGNLEVVSAADVPATGIARTSTAETTAELISSYGINCIPDYDFGFENFIDLKPSVSNEIRFERTIFSDYLESRGNRVLTIDDISGDFNDLPSPTNFAVSDEADQFTLANFRGIKYFVFMEDTRFSGEKEFTIVNLLHDNSTGYILQYGSIHTVLPLTSRFDFSIFGSVGQLLMFPVREEFNNYAIDQFSIALGDSVTTGSNVDLGNCVTVGTASTTVDASSSPSAVTVVGVNSSNYGCKTLALVNADNGEHIFTELLHVHDGTDINIVEFGSVASNGFVPYDATGIGTFGADWNGSNFDIKFTPAANVGVTVNTFNTCFSKANVGTGVTSVSTAKITTTTTGIGSTSSPVPVEIARYSTGTFDAGYYIIGVQDIHDSSRVEIMEAAATHQLSGADPIQSFVAPLPTVFSGSSGLGTVGATFSGADLVLTLTPNAGIAVTVTTLQHAIEHPVAGATTSFINFNNAKIRSFDSVYQGTKTFIKRNFPIKHGGDPVFKKDFGGNDSTIVDVPNNLVEIPNHFFVTGEKLNYGHLGIGNTMAIQISETTIAGIGSTTILPPEVYAIKLNESQLRFAATAENALAVIPTPLTISAVGIGTSHSLTTEKQNTKALVAIDNNIQAPVVGTGVTTRLSFNLNNVKSVLTVDDPNQFFGGDLIKIDDEYMKINSVGVGSTNFLVVDRPWMGTGLTTHVAGAVIEKYKGDYNIVKDTLNFKDAPIGLKPPLGSGFDGIGTSYSFQGRIFLRSAETGTTNEAYNENFLFDDISTGFNGIGKTFTLTQDEANTTGFSTNGTIVLVNEIFQFPGTEHTYTLNETGGVSKIIFRGDIGTDEDINVATIPVGGVIISVASTAGFNYQPLVAAGGTAIISAGGTITSVSIGNSGSGYRAFTPGVSTSGTYLIPFVPEVFAISTTSSLSRISIGTAVIENGNIVSIAITNPGTGYTSTNPPTIEFEDPLSYNNLPLIHTSDSPTAIGTQAKVNVVVGQGSSVIDFEIQNFGGGYRPGEILTINSGGIAGIPTNTSNMVGSATTLQRDFRLTVRDTYTDKFSAWSPGFFDPLDSIAFDGISKSYGLTKDNLSITIRSAPGSNLDMQSALLVFVNDILQKPGEAYRFTGGNVIEFTEAPKKDDSSKVLFYRGSGDIDVFDVDVLEEVEPGDAITLDKNEEKNIDVTLQQNERIISGIKTSDVVFTRPYTSVGITSDNGLKRPIQLCKQTQDYIINGAEVNKSRIRFESNILPSTPIVKSIGAGTTIIFVESVRPFFNSSKENLSGPKQDLQILDRTIKTGAACTAVISGLGTVSSYTISDGGVGYSTAPTVVVGIPTVSDPFIPTGTATEQDTAVGFGTGGMLLLTETTSDNTSFQLSMQFNVTFFGKVYNQIFVGSNGYLTFESGSAVSTDITARNPSVPGIHVCPGDRTLQRLYFLSEPTRFRGRFEGFDSGSTFGSTPLIYEFELNRGSSIIKLNTVTVSSATTGGATNGTDADYRYPFTAETGETWHIYTAPVSRAEENRATATATVSAGGTISAITVTNPGVGYTSEQPPLVIIAPPQANHESIDNVSYEGDFGIISGIKTTSVGSTDALVLDLVLPMDSVFRDANTVGTAITVSGIGSANYIVVSNTNIGHGVTSIDSTGATVGVGSTFLDNVYEVISVGTAATDAYGIGSTDAVTQVTVAVSNFNGLSGMGHSEYFGDYSFGIIKNYVRKGTGTYSAVLSDGVTGLSSSPLIVRKEKLKFTGYN